MTFGEIIPDILNDKAIRRKCWEEKEYIFINGVGSITNKVKEGYLLDYVIDDTDLKADDWEVYDDREYFDFQQALELMEQGKRVRSKAWGDIIIGYLYLSNNNEFCIEWRNEEEEKSRYYYNLKRRDLKANDWYLVEEE